MIDSRSAMAVADSKKKAHYRRCADQAFTRTNTVVEIESILHALGKEDEQVQDATTLQKESAGIGSSSQERNGSDAGEISTLEKKAKESKGKSKEVKESCRSLTFFDCL